MKLTKAKYNWLVAQYNYRKNKEQLIEISDEEYERLTGEQEPTDKPEQLETHTITFKDGDQIVQRITGSTGTYVSVPNLEKKEYEFLGWSIDGINVTMPVDSIYDNDITYIAVWEKIEHEESSEIYNKLEYLYIEALEDGLMIFDMNQISPNNNNFHVKYFNFAINCHNFTSHTYNENLNKEYNIYTYEIHKDDKIYIYANYIDETYFPNINFNYKICGNILTYKKDYQRYYLNEEMLNLNGVEFYLPNDKKCLSYNIYVPEGVILTIENIGYYTFGYNKSHETVNYIYFKNENLVVKKINNFTTLNNSIIVSDNIICIDEDNLTTHSFYYVIGASPYLPKIDNIKILKNKDYKWNLSIKTGTYPDYIMDGNDYVLDVNNLNIKIIEYDHENFEILGHL